MSRSRREGSQSKRCQKIRRRQQKKLRANQRTQRHRNRSHVKKAIHWFFGNKNIFSHLSFHGNTSWKALDLIRLALLCCWSEKNNITDGFGEAMKRCRQLGFTVALTTYQGFMLALTNQLETFMPLLILQLHRQMEEVGGKFFTFAGYVPIAFDGSRNSGPRTESNEAELCSATYGKRGKSKAANNNQTSNSKSPAAPQPQAWITLLWHMGLRLPWDWRLGPSDSSERGHVQEMLEEGDFPENTLFCGDAGFVGFEFWSSILSQGFDFLVRVGSGVKLISQDMNFQHLEEGLVLCWPKDKQAKHLPLTLRLVCIKVDGCEIYLLTSVLDSKRLPKEALLELYRMRWGIEVEFRGLKQTLNGQKLRCREVSRLYTELSWSILSMAVAELLAIREQIANIDTYDAGKRKAKKYTPKKRSLANTMRAIYDCLDELSDIPASGQDLWSRLKSAVTDDYQRTSSKKARYRPSSEPKKIKPPKIRKLELKEKIRLEKQKKIIAA